MIRPLLLLLTFAVTAGAQEITYRLERAYPLTGRTAEEIAVLEKINRADKEHLPRLERLIIPSRFDAPELAYSPLPRSVPELAGNPKSLVVHQPHQVFAAYEKGEMVRWGPVSTGRREHPTPSGLFHLNWRSPGRRSTDNPDWYMKWYYNFHNRRGLALHELELPGRPASHACVRLLARDAQWIYSWGEGWTLHERGWPVLEQGTPLWIVGTPEFNAATPWLSASAPHPSIIFADETFATAGQ
jgi:hypothetical protein